MRPTCPSRRPLCTTVAAVVMMLAMPACAGDAPDDQPADDRDPVDDPAAAPGPAAGDIDEFLRFTKGS